MIVYEEYVPASRQEEEEKTSLKTWLFEKMNSLVSRFNTQPSPKPLHIQEPKEFKSGFTILTPVRTTNAIYGAAPSVKRKLKNFDDFKSEPKLSIPSIGEYYGQCVNQKPHGIGALFFKNGDAY